MDPGVLDTEAFAPLPRAQWQAAALRRSDVHLVDTPTTTIRLRDSDQAPSGAASVVLLVDAPHTLECYDELLAELGPSIRTVVVEPPGFGFSWVTDPTAFTYTGATQAVLDALDQRGVSDAALGGACVYGHLALGVAAAAPGRARGLLLAQTPTWEAGRRWGRDVLDPDGQLATPWEGQAYWRLHRDDAAQQWYRFAAGPGAPWQRWQQNARTALNHGASYALASQSQQWFTDDAVGPAPTDLPATLLWGESDRSHRKAGTEPEAILELLPRAQVVRLPDVGHFPDTEDIATTARALRELLRR